MGLTTMMVGLQVLVRRHPRTKNCPLPDSKTDKKVLLVAADMATDGGRRQLQILGQQVGVSILIRRVASPKKVVKSAMQYALSNEFDVMLVDAAGTSSCR